MFSQASACLWKGGVHGKGGACVAKGGGACVVKGGVHFKGAYMARGHAWKGVAGGMRGRRDGHCSGWYPSYWNAFLFNIRPLVHDEWILLLCWAR